MKVNAHSFALMMHCLSFDDPSRSEIVEATGLHPVTVGEYLRALKRAKVIHVSSWDGDAKGAMTIARYRIGNRVDAKKPPPTTAVQRQQAHRERKKQIAMIHATAGRAAP